MSCSIDLLFHEETGRDPLPTRFTRAQRLARARSSPPRENKHGDILSAPVFIRGGGAKLRGKQARKSRFVRPDAINGTARIGTSRFALGRAAEGARNDWESRTIGETLRVPRRVRARKVDWQRGGKEEEEEEGEG